MTKKTKKVILVRDKRTGERWLREEAIRAAEVEFITDRQRRPPEYWWDQSCKDHGWTLQQFIVRVRQGRWVVRRDDYWEQVTQEILRQSKYRAVHDRVKELREIEDIRSDTLEAIRPKVIDGRKIYAVKPGTMEGMVGAFVKLDKLADDKRDTVLTMIEPDLSREMAEGQGSAFTPDEWRDVARMLLEKRQAQQQERLQLGTGEDRNAQETNPPKRRRRIQEEDDQEEGREDD